MISVEVSSIEPGINPKNASNAEYEVAPVAANSPKIVAPDQPSTTAWPS